MTIEEIRLEAKEEAGRVAGVVTRRSRMPSQGVRWTDCPRRRESCAADGTAAYNSRQWEPVTAVPVAMNERAAWWHLRREVVQLAARESRYREPTGWSGISCASPAQPHLAGGHIVITHYLNVPSETTFGFVTGRWANPYWRTTGSC